jgi:hypothetical protein
VFPAYHVTICSQLIPLNPTISTILYFLLLYSIMKSVIILVLSFFTLLAGICIADSYNWKFRKYENGIAVYTRTLATSPIEEVKLVDTVKSSLSAIVALMNDSKNYSAWIYHCESAKTLKVISAYEEYKYELINVPWPFSNRDIVTDFKVSQDPVTKVVTMISSAAPDYLPATDGVVRIRDFYSIYKLTPLSNGTVRVEYELDVNPTGKIPAWLINANVVTGPFTSAVALTKQLPGYQFMCYAFIREK